METALLSKTFTAVSKIEPYRVVTLGSNDYEVKQANSYNQTLIGVSGEFEVKTQEPIDVKMVGIVRVRYGATTNRGALLTTNQHGEAVTASNGHNLLGIALLSGKRAEIGSVLLTQGFK